MGVACRTARSMGGSSLNCNPRRITLALGACRQLGDPSITVGGAPLYMSKPAALREATAPNLHKPLSSLLSDGDELGVTDPVYGTHGGFALKVLLTAPAATASAAGGAVAAA